MLASVARGGYDSVATQHPPACITRFSKTTAKTGGTAELLGPSLNKVDTKCVYRTDI